MRYKDNRKYKLIYRPELALLSNYCSEEEYFEYYQNTNEPSREDDNGFKIVFDFSERISYYETALNIYRQGYPLSILTFQDFINFISEWVMCYKRNGVTSALVSFYKNEGIPLVTTQVVNGIGEIKCLWMIKKYAPNRPVGVKIARELNYSILTRNATKGIIVTTSRLTREAIFYIEKNKHRMSYIDNLMLENELRLDEKADDIPDDLPF